MTLQILPDQFTVLRNAVLHDTREDYGMVLYSNEPISRKIAKVLFSQIQKKTVKVNGEKITVGLDHPEILDNGEKQYSVCDQGGHKFYVSVPRDMK